MRVYVTQAYSDERARIFIVGHTDLHKRVVVEVLETPHRIFLAVDEDFGDIHGLRKKLNAHLFQECRRGRCDRTNCARCHPVGLLGTGRADAVEREEESAEQKDFDEMLDTFLGPRSKGSYVPNSLNDEPCARVLERVGEWVTSVHLVRRPFFYAAEPRPQEGRTFPFAQFTLRHAFLSKASKSFLTKCEYQSDIPERRGVYDYCANEVESFHRLKDFRCCAYWTIQHARHVEGNTYVCLFQDVLPCLDKPSRGLSYMVYDIETPREDARFPHSGVDPIFCISVLYANGLGGVPTRAIYAWGPPATHPHQLGFEHPIEMKMLENETEMLRVYCEDIRQRDPDVLVGYNSEAFDAPYIADRCYVVGVGFDVGVVRTGTHARVFRTNVESKQKGGSTRVQVETFGRTHLDLYALCKTNMRLKLAPNLQLRTVAQFLGLPMLKEDLSHTVMWARQHGTADERGGFLKYCAVDVEVPALLVTDTLAIVNLAQGAYVFRTTPSSYLSGGPSAKWGRLLQNYRRNHLILRVPSYYEKDNEGKSVKIFTHHPSCAVHPGMNLLWPKKYEYVGGHVVAGKPGLYKHLATLDFNSLYPSIIGANNLCNSTLVMEEDLVRMGLTPDDINWSEPMAHDIRFGFLKPHIRRGLIPDGVRDLLQLRQGAKDASKAAKQAGDRATQYAEDANSDAYKVANNSLYGLFATPGDVQCVPLAAFITGKGRRYAQNVREFLSDQWIIDDFVVVNGGFDVVYGDTDSVFVADEWSLTADEARARLKALETAVNDPLMLLFPTGCKMSFENFFHRLCLVTKKNYYGAIDDPNRPGCLKLYAKGIDTVRRSTPKFTRDCVNFALQSRLLHGNDEDHALARLSVDMQRLLGGRVPVADLSQSKKLGKPLEQYGPKNQDAHVVAARALVASGRDVRPGDLVEFVIGRSHGTKNKGPRGLATKIFNPRKDEMDIQGFAEGFAATMIRLTSLLFDPIELERRLDFVRYEDRSGLVSKIHSLERFGFKAPRVLRPWNDPVTLPKRSRTDEPGVTLDWSQVKCNDDED